MARKWAPGSFDGKKIKSIDWADAAANEAFGTFLEEHGIQLDSRDQFLERRLGRSIKEVEAQKLANINSGFLARKRENGEIRVEKAKHEIASA